MVNLDESIRKNGWQTTEKRSNSVFESFGVSVQTQTTIYNRSEITQKFPDDQLGSFIFVSELDFTPELTEKTLGLIEPLVRSQSQDKISNMLESKGLSVSTVQQRRIQIAEKTVVSQQYVCETVVDGNTLPMNVHCYLIPHDDTYSIVGSTRPQSDVSTRVDGSLLASQDQLVTTLCQKLART